MQFIEPTENGLKAASLWTKSSSAGLGVVIGSCSSQAAHFRESKIKCDSRLSKCCVSSDAAAEYNLQAFTDCHSQTRRKSGSSAIRFGRARFNVADVNISCVGLEPLICLLLAH